MCFSEEVIAPVTDFTKVEKTADKIIKRVGTKEDRSQKDAYKRRQKVLDTLLRDAIKLPQGFDIEPVQDTDRDHQPWHLGIFNTQNQLVLVF